MQQQQNPNKEIEYLSVKGVATAQLAALAAPVLNGPHIHKATTTQHCDYCIVVEYVKRLEAEVKEAKGRNAPETSDADKDQQKSLLSCAPALNLALTDQINSFILSLEDRDEQERAQQVAFNRYKSVKNPWFSLFPPPGSVVEKKWDDEDGCYRCGKCNWEVAGVECTNCGQVFRAEDEEEENADFEEGENEVNSSDGDSNEDEEDSDRDLDESGSDDDEDDSSDDLDRDLVGFVVDSDEDEAPDAERRKHKRNGSRISDSDDDDDDIVMVEDGSDGEEDEYDEGNDDEEDRRRRRSPSSKSKGRVVTLDDSDSELEEEEEGNGEAYKKREKKDKKTKKNKKPGNEFMELEAIESSGSDSETDRHRYRRRHEKRHGKDPSGSKKDHDRQRVDFISDEEERNDSMSADTEEEDESPKDMDCKRHGKNRDTKRGSRTVVVSDDEDGDGSDPQASNSNSSPARKRKIVDSSDEGEDISSDASSIQVVSVKRTSSTGKPYKRVVDLVSSDSDEKEKKDGRGANRKKRRVVDVDEESDE
ncbi:UNVERIFIED_CONTAM: hypothetical protein HDU68_006888 [Siphonaria sp. JEL0065]|nr:hypothetical protein HDU68_006888 [Siphonaria sp. JEL0065]